MLKTALTVLQSHWEHVKTNERYKKAYKDGMKKFKKYYGEELLLDIAHKCTCGEFRRAFVGTITLLKYAPRSVAEYTSKKASHFGRNTFKTIVPASFRRLMAKWLDIVQHRAIGHIRFGDLRQVIPLGREFSDNRGLLIDSYYFENFIARNTNDINGHVLEIGGDYYTQKFSEGRVTNSNVLHLPNNSRITTLEDMSFAGHLPSKAFDCIILPPTLHLIYKLSATVKTLHNLLKPGGKLLAIVPGINRINYNGSVESGYWMFTSRTVHRLFREVFPEEFIKIETYGNVLAATALLHGLTVEELRREELDYTDPHYQVAITIRAVKAK
jgi:SAM-dependent methyltransferase